MEGFVIKSGFNWQHFCIEEKTGLFYSQGSFGKYAHCWSHIGERTLKEFLTSLNYDYFMGKCASEKYKPDIDKTLKSMKNHITYTRREKACNKSDAREVYNLLKDLESDGPFNSIDLLLQTLYDDELATKVLGDDIYEFTSYSYSSDCKGFWEEMWPKFLEKIEGTLNQ